VGAKRRPRHGSGKNLKSHGRGREGRFSFLKEQKRRGGKGYAPGINSKKKFGAEEKISVKKKRGKVLSGFDTRGRERKKSRNGEPDEKIAKERIEQERVILPAGDEFEEKKKKKAKLKLDIKKSKANIRRKKKGSRARKVSTKSEGKGE